MPRSTASAESLFVLFHRYKSKLWWHAQIHDSMKSLHLLRKPPVAVTAAVRSYKFSKARPDEKSAETHWTYTCVSTPMICKQKTRINLPSHTNCQHPKETVDNLRELLPTCRVGTVTAFWCIDWIENKNEKYLSKIPVAPCLYLFGCIPSPHVWRWRWLTGTSSPS